MDSGIVVAVVKLWVAISILVATAILLWWCRRKFSSSSILPTSQQIRVISRTPISRNTHATVLEIGRQQWLVVESGASLVVRRMTVALNAEVV